jgi:hypothetical protein
MALLKLSGMATAISGKLGGSVFGTSANGSYVKQNSWSQQHASQAQSAQRTQLYLTTQEWRSITQTQKDNWAAETPNYPYTNKVGDIVEYTGYQLFNMLNANLKVIGVNPNLSPPAFVAITAESITLPFISGGIMTVSYTGHDIAAHHVIYVTLPLKSPNPPKLSDFKFLLATTTGTANGNLVLSGLYNSKFGTRPAGTYVYCYIKQVNSTTGNPSPISNIAGGIVS